MRWLIPSDFESAALEVFEPKKPRNKNKRTEKIHDEICESLIGTSYEICAELWNLINPVNTISKSSRPKHLLWTLLFLRTYNTENVNTRLVGGADNETFRNWCWHFVGAIAALEHEVIIWDNRLRQYDGVSVCLVSVDCTDCPIKEPWPFDTKVFSEKYNGPAYKYEVAVCIRTGDIVWINGPFEAGKHDITIFRNDGLMQALCDDECIEADRGYQGEDRCKNPNMTLSDSDSVQKSRVRCRHEIVNGRLKRFRILDDVFRSQFDTEEKHGKAFRAVAVITQLGFELHGHLYDVKYNVMYS
eukprot:scaffold8090_cov82-Cylindrotheca_fusiformis.AAC.11